MEEAPLPLQSAVNHEVIKPVSGHEEMALENPEQGDLPAQFDTFTRLSEIYSHSPPLIKAPINTPLIC
jgi:hypothetical protein